MTRRGKWWVITGGTTPEPSLSGDEPEQWILIDWGQSWDKKDWKQQEYGDMCGYHTTEGKW